MSLTYQLSKYLTRLQNSPYFCVFKYARAVKRKVWKEDENRERDWGETLKIRFFLSPHTPYGRVGLARFALKTLTPRLTDSFTDFEKKNWLFCSSILNQWTNPLTDNWKHQLLISFKIFPQFCLAKSTRIIHLNQLLMTKFGRILCLTRKQPSTG